MRAPCWKQSTGYIPEDLQARHVKYVLNQKSKQVLEALSLDFRSGVPGEMLYSIDADDLVLIVESLEKLTEKFELWRSGMNSKGLRVDMVKTNDQYLSQERVHVVIVRKE